MREAHRKTLKRARGYGALARRLLSHRRKPAPIAPVPVSSGSHRCALRAIAAALAGDGTGVSQRDEQGVAISQTQLAAHTSILVSPRLSLSMLVTHRRAGATASQGTVHRRLRSRRAEVPRTAASLSRNSEQPVRTQPEIVERIVRRTVRKEALERRLARRRGRMASPIARSAPGVNARATASSASGMVCRCERPNEPCSGRQVAEQAEAEPQRPAATAGSPCANAGPSSGRDCAASRTRCCTRSTGGSSRSASDGEGLSHGAGKGDDQQHRHRRNACPVLFNPEEYSLNRDINYAQIAIPGLERRRCCSSSTATCRRWRWSCSSTPTRSIARAAAVLNQAGDDVRAQLTRKITELMNIEPDDPCAARADVHLGLALVHLRAGAREPALHHVPARRRAGARAACR